MYMNPVKIL